MELENQTLFKRIEANVKRFEDKCVFMKKSGNNVTTCNYRNLIDESISRRFQNIPSYVCLGILIEKETYFPMIIYSLLEHQLCFTFLNPKDYLETNEEIIRDLKLYGLITCEAQHNYTQFKDSSTFETKCGSSVQFWFNPTFDPEIYENIFYIMSTSGTCGNQKYVRVTEESIKSNVLCLSRKMNIHAEDVIYFGTPLSFDPSMIELFTALTTGATLLAVSADIWENPQKFSTNLFTEPSPVTFIQMCPSVFTRWTDREIEFIFTQTTLRVLALGGEPFPKKLLGFKRKSDLKLFNLYGITEVSCWATICDVKDEVHLGEALDDTLLEVKDENGLCIKEGSGEMFIGSNSRICLLNNETIETINFPIFRSTGDLVHVKNNIFTYEDRLIRVIKRFGHRINLNTLEENIRNITDLENICVWNEKTQQISTFLKIQNHNGIQSKILDKIRVKLLKEIESKFFPDQLYIIDEIPLTTNGKVDLKKIKRLHTTETNLDLYKKLWCKYLCISNETANERKMNTFMEMGGNSIMRLQLISEFMEVSKGSLDSIFINKLLDSNFQQACNLLATNIETIKKKFHETKCFKINWHQDMLMCIDAPATLFNYSNQLCVAIGNFANIFAIFDAMSGNELYKVFLPKTIENGSAFSAETNRVCVGSFDGVMYCIDLCKKEIVWKYATGDRIKNRGCFCCNNSTLVFGSYDNNLYSVTIKEGLLVWQVDLGEPITSNPICIRGLIIVASLKGTISCLKEESGHVIWKRKVENPVFTNPKTFKECVLYSDVGGYIYNIDLLNGNLIWIYKPLTPLNMYSTFLLYKNFIIFGMRDKSVHFLKFSDTNCKHSHSVEIGHEVMAEPKIFEANNRTYLLSVATDGHILLHELIDNGLKLYDSFNLGEECFSQAVFHENTMFIGCRDNNLYSITIEI